MLKGHCTDWQGADLHARLQPPSWARQGCNTAGSSITKRLCDIGIQVLCTTLPYLSTKTIPPAVLFVSAAQIPSMQSPKRSRNGPLEDDRTHKRACSNPLYQTSATLTQDEPRGVAAISHTTDIPMASPFLGVQASCMHKRCCMLSLPTCCACSDKRPVSHGSPLHIDKGLGNVVTSNILDRSEYYCPGCQGNTQGMA